MLDAAALAAYRLVASRYDTSGGLQSLARVLFDAQFFEVLDGESVCGRFALRLNCFEHGCEGEVVAAAGALPGVDLTHSVLPVIEQHIFANVQAVKVVTRRRALVSKLLNRGYRIDAFVMRKAPDART